MKERGNLLPQAEDVCAEGRLKGTDGAGKVSRKNSMLKLVCSEEHVSISRKKKGGEQLHRTRLVAAEKSALTVHRQKDKTDTWEDSGRKQTCF